MLYKEKKDKLKLFVSDSDGEVKIGIDCFNGTIGSLSFKREKIKLLKCGETTVISSAAELKGKAVTFRGGGNNPDGGSFKITHKIFETGGGELVYTFPDDYTGEEEYDEEDLNPYYKFSVKFE